MSFIKLAKKRSKPVFRLEISTGTIRCVLDTGADMPVWCSVKRTFKKRFCDSYDTGRKFLLGGFGKGVSEVDIYCIPEFNINEFRVKNLYVAVDSMRRFEWDLILSYSMFSKIDYSIINTHKDSPLLELNCSRDTYYCGLHYHNGNLVESIYCFAQEDAERTE